MSTFRLSRIATLFALGGEQRLLLVEAAIHLARARLRIRNTPFAQVAAALGRLVPPDAVGAATPRQAQHDIARDIGWAVRTVAPLVPFRAMCLEQSIAAQTMLRRRAIPSVLHLGVDRTDLKMKAAHAWLSAGPICLTGYPLAPTMTAIGVFVCDAGQREP